MQNRNGSDQFLTKRILMSAIGVLVCGISVGMFRRAELGVDPFQTLMSGIDALVSISFGTMYVIANIVLLAFALIMDRRKIGLATIINLFFLGYVADAVEKLLRRLIPEAALPVRFLLLLAAVLIMCFASAFYFTADLGVSTYDAVSLIISEKQEKVAFRFCRIISDLVCVCLGTLLCRIAGFSWIKVTSTVGIGTIITAFFMGPLISYFNDHAAIPFLYGKNGKPSGGADVSKSIRE